MKKSHDERMMIFELLVQVLERMGSENISCTDLARRMQTTPGRVKQIFGGPNLTARTMTRLARAVGCTIRVTLEPDTGEGE